MADNAFALTAAYHTVLSVQLTAYDPLMVTFATDGLLTKAATILREEGASEVYVFGSFARGCAGPDSDLDLAVIGLPEGKLLHAMGRILSEVGRLSDLVRMESEPAFVCYLQSTGELRRVA